METILILLFLFIASYIALESRRTSELLISINSEQKRIKEFIFHQYHIQVYTYNVLRLKELKDINSNHTMYGSPTRNLEIDEKVNEINDQLSKLRVRGWELETEEEHNERIRNIINETK